MDAQITIPLWFFLLLSAVFVLVIINLFLFPGVRWFFRKKINRAINELNARLNIKLRPFQLTKRQVLLDRLVHDPEVLEFAQQQAIDDEVPREVLMEQVQQYAREIVPSFNAYVYYRLGYWLSKKIAKLLYRVRVRVGEHDHLTEVSKDATVVFVMNHRSNMDYILVSFLVAEKMALSYAVGEWARVWPLRGLIKSMGAYFVRRNSRNPLYRKVLERYIDMATREGVCQAVFPEGGLSKDGQIRPPKLGFLDYMLRHYDNDQHRDVVFIPVGINYDRVLEDKTLLRSLDPEASRKSNWFAIKTTLKFIWNNIRLARKHQWHRFGYASVSFATPISTKEYCANASVNFNCLPSEQRFSEIEKLANHLMLSVEKTVPIVPVVLMSEVIRQNGNQSLSIGAAKEQAKLLMAQIEQSGGHMVFPHKDKELAMDAAIDRLKIRHIIQIEDGNITFNEDGLSVLNYYANSINYWSRADTLSSAE